MPLWRPTFRRSNKKIFFISEGRTRCKTQVLLVSLSNVLLRKSSYICIHFPNAVFLVCFFFFCCVQFPLSTTSINCTYAPCTKSNFHFLTAKLQQLSVRPPIFFCICWLVYSSCSGIPKYNRPYNRNESLSLLYLCPFSRDKVSHSFHLLFNSETFMSASLWTLSERERELSLRCVLFLVRFFMWESLFAL